MGAVEGHWSQDGLLAYQAMAPAYDAFTAHHNYDLWLGHMLPKLEQHGLAGDRLLDAACGTGKSFLPMRRRGWTVTGTDISPAMIDVARAKVAGDDGVELGVADLRELPVLGEFDLVWALADAVNYLLDPDELVAALAGLGRNLAPTGLLVFDTNTLQTYRTFFAEEEVVDGGDCRLIWKGRTAPNAPAGVLAEATFEAEPIEPGGGGRRIPPTLHRERHFPEADVRAALERAGLVLLGVYGHHYDAIPHQPLDEDHDIKAIYIAAAELA
ncbi:MAG TPA: class I SAM-dependent methyltransferase [Solirubrobacterales bacterium]|nr:class I SAM-dependent methyltransferase [Solirubrobacterales bacterium]